MFEYKVTLFGKTIATGTESFSSAGNAELMLRARHANALPAPGQWSFLEVQVKPVQQ